MNRRQKLQLEQLIGIKTAELQENEAFKHAMETLERKTLSDWENASNPEDREHCWYLHRALKDLSRQLAAQIGAKMIADKELNR